jgi:O-antigen biosynthesis protein
MALTLSICIPSKNRPADVLRCLESIGRQEALPQEILIVDQSDVAYALPGMKGLVHAYDPALSGISAARNLGARKSACDIILYLDDDVELLPGCLRTLLDAFETFPDAVGMCCGVVASGESRLQWWQVHTWLFCRGFFNASQLVGKGGLIELRRIYGCAAALRRSLLLKEPFDENLIGYSYGEDWELACRLRAYGTLRLVPESRVIHHVSPTNRYGMRQLQRDRWDNFLYFYEKLNASRFFMNRFWKAWWMLGESILWLKEGMGLPFLGLQSDNAPTRSRSLRRSKAD